MDNRYFWIKDRLRSERIKVEYCPTSIMVADFFTKPLQGSLFKKLRDVVLGYSHVSTLAKGMKETTFQERVEKSGNLVSKSNESYADVVKKGIEKQNSNNIVEKRVNFSLSK